MLSNITLTTVFRNILIDFWKLIPKKHHWLIKTIYIYSLSGWSMWWIFTELQSNKINIHHACNNDCFLFIINYNTYCKIVLRPKLIHCRNCLIILLHSSSVGTPPASTGKWCTSKPAQLYSSMREGTLHLKRQCMVLQLTIVCARGKGAILI